MEDEGGADEHRQYVHDYLSPTFHTPVLLVHPPEFTKDDKELLTQFFFEKLKVPGLSLMSSSLCALWAYGLSTATIIDVGFEKTDITPVVDFLVQSRVRKTVADCGGESMTEHLRSLLPDMKPEWIETLKKSPICEILPPGAPIPGSGEIAHGQGVLVDEDEDDINMLGEDEGAINVAAIVASGKTKEFLAQKEKEKRGEAERKLPNREREVNYFWVVDEKMPGEEEGAGSVLTSPVVGEAPAFPAEGAQTSPVNTSPTTTGFPPLDAEKAHKESEKRKQTRLAASQGIILKQNETWRELSVGTERFRAAECGILHSIADAVYAVIQSVDEIGKRAELWDNLIIVGNGSKVKGM